MASLFIARFSGQCLLPLSRSAPIIGVTFNPANDELASNDINGTVIVWDLTKSSRLFEFTDNDQFPLAWSSGEQLTTGQLIGQFVARAFNLSRLSSARITNF